MLSYNIFDSCLALGLMAGSVFKHLLIIFLISGFKNSIYFGRIILS